MYPGALYTATCDLTAVTVQADLIEMVAPAAGAIIPWELSIGQVTEIGDAQEEDFLPEWWRGHTSGGSGGSTITPVPGNSGITAASLPTIKMLNTTLASGGTPTRHNPRVQWNVRAGLYLPMPPPGPWLLRNSERMVLRMDRAPTDSITLAVSFSFWVL